MTDNQRGWWSGSHAGRPAGAVALVLGVFLMAVGWGPIGLALILLGVAVLLAEYEDVLTRRSTRRRR